MVEETKTTKPLLKGATAVTATTTEETSTQSRPRSKTARPKPATLWTVAEVLKWYKIHCGEYQQYRELFLKNEITGRALLRINDYSLQRMGITNNRDREAIWREITKQRLKNDIMELRDMERIIASK